MQKKNSITAKLPKIELPKFNGNIQDWTAFWQLFEATINKREDLTKVEKFTYLHSPLQGETARMVYGFAVTDENYGDIVAVFHEHITTKQN